MTLKYLIDENVNPIYPNQIRLREPDIMIKLRDRLLKNC